MRTILALATIAVISAAGAAYATGQGRDVATSATAQAIPVDRIKANIDKLGYEVERAKADEGIYKMRLVDRDSGGKVDATFDATTGELTRAKLARKDDNPEIRKEVRDHKEKRDHKEHDEDRRKGRQDRD